MKFKTFEAYWEETWKSSPNIPAVFDLAMKEIAHKAWNTALDQAISIANSYVGQDKIMDMMADLK